VAVKAHLDPVGAGAAPAGSGSRQRVDYRLQGLDLTRTDIAPPLPPSPPAGKRPRRALRRVATGWVIVLVVGVVTALVLRLAILQPYSVTTSAMEPVLHEGDRIVVATSSALGGSIARGDIVVFRQPASPRCTDGPGDLAERVIGMPGDSLFSRAGTIYIDDRPLHQASWYNERIGEVGTTPIAPITLGADQYFVLGDDPKVACDSRTFGAVPGSSIVGKAVAVVMRGGRPDLHLL
jgi:signal peptidase I